MINKRSITGLLLAVFFFSLLLAPVARAESSIAAASETAEQEAPADPGGETKESGDTAAEAQQPDRSDESFWLAGTYVLNSDIFDVLTLGSDGSVRWDSPSAEHGGSMEGSYYYDSDDASTVIMNDAGEKLMRLKASGNRLTVLVVAGDLVRLSPGDYFEYVAKAAVPAGRFVSGEISLDLAAGSFQLQSGGTTLASGEARQINERLFLFAAAQPSVGMAPRRPDYVFSLAANGLRVVTSADDVLSAGQTLENVPRPGRYALAREPWRLLVLNEDGTYHLWLEMVKSYLPHGQYDADGRILTLYADDKEVPAVTFILAGDTLSVDMLPPMIRRLFSLRDDDVYEFVYSNGLLNGTYRSADGKVSFTASSGQYELSGNDGAAEKGFCYAYNDKLLLDTNFITNGSGQPYRRMLKIEDLELVDPDTGDRYALDFFADDRAFVGDADDHPILTIGSDRSWQLGDDLGGRVVGESGPTFTLETDDGAALVLTVRGDSLYVDSRDESLAGSFVVGGRFEQRTDEN